VSANAIEPTNSGHLDPAARIQAYYAALNAFDLGALEALLAEDAVTFVPGKSAITGAYRGRAELLSLAARARDETDGTFHVEPLDVLTNASHAVVRHRWTATRKGTSIEQTNFNVYRFTDGGLLIERWEFAENQAEHDAFWSA
jgi:ketosteroid isomerase-like protein